MAKIAGSAIPGGIASTAENLTAIVDPTVLNASDPPPGVVLNTQASITDFLASVGTTAFKTLEGLHEALPQRIDHIVTVTMPGAVTHLPLSPQISLAEFPAAFNFTGKLWGPGGKIIFQGEVDTSLWPEVVAGLFTVTSHVTTGLSSVTSTGAGLAGNAAKGAYIVLDTGDIFPILGNDSDTLQVQMLSAAAITDGVTTFRIQKPATVWENSLNGTDTFNSIGAVFVVGQAFGIGAYEFNHIQVNDFGTTSFQARHCDVKLDTTILDKTAGPVAEQGFGLLFQDCQYEIRHFIHKATPGSSADEAVYHSSAGTVFGSWIGAYLLCGDGAKGVRLWGGGTVRTFGFTLEGAPLQTFNGAFIESTFSDLVGRRSTIKGVTSSSALGGLILNHTVSWFHLVSQTHKIWFEGNTRPCVYLKRGAVIPQEVALEVFDGGGNTDVGVELEYGNISAPFGAASDVTGTLGDIRLEDGTIVSWASLSTSANPLQTTRGSLISRG